jgi:hypothetical protein
MDDAPCWQCTNEGRGTEQPQATLVWCCLPHIMQAAMASWSSSLSAQKQGHDPCLPSGFKAGPLQGRVGWAAAPGPALPVLTLRYHSATTCNSRALLAVVLLHRLRWRVGLKPFQLKNRGTTPAYPQGSRQRPPTPVAVVTGVHARLAWLGYCQRIALACTSCVV